MTKNSTSFSKNNEAALKHGGAAAYEAIKQDRPFTGPAADMEETVKAELVELGRVEIERRGAIRLETVSRLYYNALQDAAQKNDLERLHGYVLMFCRLQVAALRAWAQVGQGEAREPDTLDYEELLRQNGHSELG